MQLFIKSLLLYVGLLFFKFILGAAVDCLLLSFFPSRCVLGFFFERFPLSWSLLGLGLFPGAGEVYFGIGVSRTGGQVVMRWGFDSWCWVFDSINRIHTFWHE